MKKIIICLTALLVFAACNNKAENQGNNGAEGENGTATTEMTDATDDKAEQDGWKKQTTLMANKPMVVDLFATWCGPCKELAPILDEIEKKHKGEVIFKRIDVDQEPELAMEFGVEAIPMLLFITPEGEYQSVVGLQEPAFIEAKIAQLLEKSAK